MSSVNALLSQRTGKSLATSKMSQMAQQSANGQLTSFSGVFSMIELNDHEKQQLASLLEQYAKDDLEIDKDLELLMSITGEVKAINNQAALLHGERIKKAHGILTRYHDGAFTAWLIATYGNRQTPYNFWQYYEFCEAMPRTLRPRIEKMPRQAIYTLASRQAPFDQKLAIVERYNGETKTELLTIIRAEFPLAVDDKRADNAGDNLLQHLEKAIHGLHKLKVPPSSAQKARLVAAAHELLKLGDAGE
jgi:hypothetical protein